MKSKCDSTEMVRFDIVPNMVTFHKRDDAYNKALELNGQIFKNTDGCEFYIAEYINSHNVIIRFINTGYTVRTEYKHIKSGSIKDVYHPIIYGVGYIGDGTYPVKKRSEILAVKCYSIWIGMLNRCYNDNVTERNSTYYDKIKACNDWLCYQNFAYWYFPSYYELPNDEMICIDKDLLSRYFNIEPIYSPNTCCLLPESINRLLLTRKKSRGDCLIGVYRNSRENTSKPFCSSFSCDGNTKTLGLFRTEMEAFLAYKNAKENRIKQLADLYRQYINPIVYEALYSYEVREDD